MRLPLERLPQQSPISQYLIGLGLILSFGVFFFWPHPPAALLLLGLAAVFTWMRLGLALALLPLTFPYYLDLLPLTPHRFPAFSLLELGLLLCLGVALARHLLLAQERHAGRERLRTLWHQARPLFLAALLFLVGASLATLASPDMHQSLRAYREEILEPLLYFLLILRYFHTLGDVARCVGALLLSAVVAAGTGITQGVFHLSNGLLYVDATTFRVNGPYGSPNNLAFLLDRALPILLALACIGIMRRQYHHTGLPARLWSDPLRWVCLVSMVPLCWALSWTGSRGAALALAAVFILFLFFEIRHWFVWASIAVAGAGAAALLPTRLIGALDMAGHGILSERLLLWKAGLLMIRDHLVLGTGPDSFNTLYTPASPASYALQALDGHPFPAAYSPQLSHPHNILLDLWISTGVLGLIAFCWALVECTRVARRGYQLSIVLRHGPVVQCLLLGIGGSLVAMLVHGLVDNAYFLPDLAMIFWLFAGLLLVIQARALHEQQRWMEHARAWSVPMRPSWPDDGAAAARERTRPAPEARRPQRRPPR